MGRLLAFTDGVFAIAITLLVLNIPLPQLGHERSNSALWTALLGQAGALIGFAVSFYVVGLQWMIHHRLLRYLDRVNGRVLTLNLGYLLFVCLLPFTTAVLVRYGDYAVAVDLYAGNVAVASLVAAALRIYLHGHRDLLDTSAPAATRLGYVRSLLPPAVFIVSMPVAWIPAEGLGINLGILCWMLMVPIGRLLYAPIGREDHNPLVT